MRRIGSLFPVASLLFAGVEGFRVPAAAGRMPAGTDIVNTAMKYLGVRYNYGGTGSAGFDCSGFVRFVYMRHGIHIPRTSEAQYCAGYPVTMDKAKPGDLLFFTVSGRRISHVGIYLGERKFIHAPSSGKSVSIGSLDASYWSRRFSGAATYLNVQGEKRKCEKQKR